MRAQLRKGRRAALAGVCRVLHKAAAFRLLHLHRKGGSRFAQPSAALATAPQRPAMPRAPARPGTWRANRSPRSDRRDRRARSHRPVGTGPPPAERPPRGPTGRWSTARAAHIKPFGQAGEPVGDRRCRVEGRIALSQRPEDVQKRFGKQVAGVTTGLVEPRLKRGRPPEMRRRGRPETGRVRCAGPRRSE